MGKVRIVALGTFCCLAATVVAGCNTNKTLFSVRQVEARVLDQGEVERFNLGGAVVGGFIGHMVDDSGFGLGFGGLIGGAAAAGGCVLPLMVGDTPLALRAPEQECTDRKPNDVVTVEETTTWTVDEKGAVVIPPEKTYQWSR